MPVWGNDNFNWAINEPTFSNYTSIGNCDLVDVSPDMYKESPTVSIEINRILEDMKKDSANTLHYEHLARCFDERVTTKASI